MRYLHVNNIQFDLEDHIAEKLLVSGAVYVCPGNEEGETHDLHLSPDHKFNLVEVEMLLGVDE